MLSKCAFALLKKLRMKLFVFEYCRGDGIRHRRCPMKSTGEHIKIGLEEDVRSTLTREIVQLLSDQRSSKLGILVVDQQQQNPMSRVSRSGPYIIFEGLPSKIHIEHGSGPF